MSSHQSYPVKINLNNWNRDYTDKRRNRNKITSTRYTWYSFIPVVIFEQFQIISNFYFLILIVVNGLIDSPLPFGADIFPLSLLIFLSLLARAYEEIKLYLSDKEINELMTYYLRDNNFLKCEFQSLNVGDIVKCENNTAFPADLLLLYSSRDTNECSVTTVNLDGESNLKTFRGVINPINEANLEEEIQQKQMEINCIESCEDLYKFHGVLLEKTDRFTLTTVLTDKSLLLRGAKLKNTDFVVGCVVYAGHNTKLSLNSKVKKLKSSVVDSALHLFILIYLVLQFLLAFVSCLVNNLIYFTPQWLEKNWYVPAIKIGSWKQVETFLGFFLLYNKLLPVSLIFSIYTMKAAAAFFFNMDLTIYDEDIDQKARVNTIELIEELGQIEYLFSDKTGTLTENKMKFHCCSTGNEIYRDFNDELYLDTLGESVKIEKITDQHLIELFTCLCLCHTVKVSNSDGSPNQTFTEETIVSDLLYQACSPDEEALLYAIRNYGIAYLGEKKDAHYISVNGKVKKYKMRDVLEFDSTRKCMSVIVECPDGSFQLICKGAESSLFPLAENTFAITGFMENLAAFSQQGLRVLVIAKRILVKEDVETFCNNLNTYRSSPDLVERESELYSIMENKLTLIGVTGVEDKLQDGVPETIYDLREAGIKIWVITGDKEETAVNISLSAGHFDQEMYIHRLTNIESIEQCVERLNLLSNLLTFSNTKSHALVVDGKSFVFLVESFIVKEFMDICSSMKATLCCRMTPLQKSQIVQIVKENIKPTPITAAIGDGGNDVSMILEAHVGIGIFGKEGRQAARIADYAIGKFKFLRPAILIHGQNFYSRLSVYIKLFFFKSVLYVIPIFLYSFFNAITALNMYDTVGTSTYNLTFTTLPILLYGIFEKNVPDEVYLLHPNLYRRISRNREMNLYDFFKSFIFAVFQSALVFFIIYFIFSYNFGFTGTTGNSYDFFFFGLLNFYCIWGVLLTKVALLSKNISKTVAIVFFANIAFSFLSQIIYEVITQDIENFLVIIVLSEPFSWLLIFIVILICSFSEIFMTLSRNYCLNELKDREQLL